MVWVSAEVALPLDRASVPILGFRRFWRLPKLSKLLEASRASRASGAYRKPSARVSENLPEPAISVLKIRIFIVGPGQSWGPPNGGLGEALL